MMRWSSWVRPGFCNFDVHMKTNSTFYQAMLFFSLIALLGFVTTHCSGGSEDSGSPLIVGSGDGVSTNESSEEGTVVENDIESIIIGSPPTEPDLQNPPKMGEGNLIDPAVDTTIFPPPDCEEICMEFNNCSTDPNNFDQACFDSCQSNVCVPFHVPPDSNALTKYTIPPRYESRNIRVTSCIDHSDVLLLGWSLRFFHLEATTLPLIDSTIQTGVAGTQPGHWVQAGADVGRAAHCPDKLKYTALLEFENASGEMEEFKWAQPAYAGVPVANIIGLENIEPGSAIYYTFEAVSGPGAIMPRVYNNNFKSDPMQPSALGIQLLFAIEYYFWFDPVYTFDGKAWYLPKQETSNELLPTDFPLPTLP